MSETLVGNGLDGETFQAIYYGSVARAHAYFATRLHEEAWSYASPEDRPKALWAATQIIDSLRYRGAKHAVAILGRCSTTEEVQAAHVAQPLEFPRGVDTVVPLDVEVAVYELAHSLLDGKDPETELEALGITSVGYSSVRTTYNRNQVPLEHLINGVPNAYAWRLLKPYLHDGRAIRLNRVS